MKWGEYALEAAQVLGRPLDSAKFYKEQMEAAGFINVEAKVYKWPQCSWPKDRKYKEMGKLCIPPAVGVGGWLLRSSVRECRAK